MNEISSRDRAFLYRIDISTFYTTYLRWFRHLVERLGKENTLFVWKSAFSDYDDEYLLSILSLKWYQAEPNGSNRVADKIGSLANEVISITNLGLSELEVRNIIENTPPIFQIRRCFSSDTMETDISAYDALHLRFDGLAYLAEAIIKAYGKQGELVIYDLIVKDRLASSQGKQGSIEQFIADFTAQPDKPNLFTAGLEIEKISEMPREIIIDVRQCEWARYFRERHPKVGYLLACSTDEVAYRSFNENLRLQRTKTIMEGAEKCDFRIYAVRDSG